MSTFLFATVEEKARMLWKIFYALEKCEPNTLYTLIEENEDFMKANAHLYDGHPEGSEAGQELENYG
jgi:hypothetical protein